MEHQLPALPYPKNSLEPQMSQETLIYHHDKHHQAYVKKLNELIKGTQFESKPLEEIIKQAEGPIFNNAAQHWNHSFFWKCLSPFKAGHPGGKINDLINENWGSFDKFKEDFKKQALANFGSGWTWLIINHQQRLEIFNTSNADNPFKHDYKAILTLDIWEHAYYIDYRNARPDFVDSFWKIVDWDFVNENLSS